MTESTPNPGKNQSIQVNGDTYARFPIKTPVIQNGDDLSHIIHTTALPHMRTGDMLFMSERIVAISQGRAYPIANIQPSALARFLVRFVHKSPYGIGLGSPWTMELALKEAGAPRMLFAAAVAAITKPFGFHGMFYRVVGHNINAIDGPCDYTLPPYNTYAKLGPAQPHIVAQKLALEIGYPVVIIDANDLGVAILGKSNRKIDDDLCAQVFRDNPLGQSDEQTPLCIVRQMSQV